MIKNKQIVLGITSSISAYKDLELIRILREKGANVLVMMSPNAAKLVEPKEFEAASENPVAVEQFAPGVDFRAYLKKDEAMRHISLADRADCIILCPCTANTIGKIASGIADTLVCSTVMATQAPVIVCPAMNVKMWLNPIMQENVLKLKKQGYEFVDPEKGILACGYEGMGRLATFDKVVARLELAITRSHELKGKKILVTAGATIEEIDPVRVITNKSSGKMGVYLAEEAAKRGAKVTLIRGKNSVEPMYFGVQDLVITSVSEMLGAVKGNVIANDIMVHAAAVSDFTINKSEEKIKSDSELKLELTPATKIFDLVKGMNRNIFLVGFKAEYNISQKELIQRAHKRLLSSNGDIVVANDVGRPNCGFDSETNEVYIIDRQGRHVHVSLADKRAVAGKVLDEIIKRIQ